MRSQLNYAATSFPGYAEFNAEFDDESDEFDKEFFESEMESGWMGEISRSSADYIRWVQQSLNKVMGLQLAEDGRSGVQTRSAVRSFQQRSGLSADGDVGPQTEAALIKAGASPPPGSPASAGGSIYSSLSTGIGSAFDATGAFFNQLWTTATGGFRPIPVEVPGGGRIKNITPPASADLVLVAGVGGKRVPLHRLAAAAWQALVAAARSDGLASPLLLPTSGFRDPETQRRLWEDALKKYGSPEKARKWVAPPGGSPHQSGRAIDFHLGGRNNSENVTALRGLPAYHWMVQNAQRFGFYPYTTEPWHWEYNPPA